MSDIALTTGSHRRGRSSIWVWFGNLGFYLAIAAAVLIAVGLSLEARRPTAAMWAFLVAPLGMILHYSLVSRIEDTLRNNTSAGIIYALIGFGAADLAFAAAFFLLSHGTDWSQQASWGLQLAASLAGMTAAIIAVGVIGTIIYVLFRTFDVTPADPRLKQRSDTAEVKPRRPPQRKETSIAVRTDPTSVLAGADQTLMGLDVDETQMSSTGRRTRLAGPVHVPGAVEAKAAAEGMPVLKGRRGAAAGQVVTVDFGDEPVTIGRSRSNGMLLPIPAASRVHAKVVYENGAVHVYDNASVNGTRVNGVPTNHAVLNFGDVIEIVDCEIAFTCQAHSVAGSDPTQAVSLYRQMIAKHPAFRTPYRALIGLLEKEPTAADEVKALREKVEELAG